MLAAGCTQRPTTDCLLEGFFFFFFFLSESFFVYLARLHAAENIAARLRQHGYGSAARAEMTKDLLQDDVDALRWLLATDNATAAPDHAARRERSETVPHASAAAEQGANLLVFLMIAHSRNLERHVEPCCACQR